MKKPSGFSRFSDKQKLHLLVLTKSQNDKLGKNFLCSFITDLYRTLNWILEEFYPSREAHLLNETLYLLHKCDCVLHNRGKKGLILYVKALRTNMMNFLSGNSTRLCTVKLDRSGLPRDLGRFWRDRLLYVSSPDYSSVSVVDWTLKSLAVLNTVLYSTRSFKIGLKPDVTSITNSSTADEEEYDIFLDALPRVGRLFWRSLGSYPSRSVPKCIRWSFWHFTTKSGPSGQALFTSLTDLYSLPQSLVENIKTVVGGKLSKVIDTLMHEETQSLLRGCGIVPKAKPKIEGSRDTSIRRVSYFPDMEDKVRVIGVLDYFSQTCLKPLHKFIYRVLSTMPSDCTYNQGKFQENLRGADIYYSIDLTAATDRFPIKVISSLLKCRFPEEFVAAWEDIMIGYPFTFTNNKKMTFLSYEVGNPMGAYSSWASFAITNHFLVYYICDKLKIDYSSVRYSLLGDDIVITNKEVAVAYIALMKILGVEVSELKTHSSPYLYEFAKRWVYKGTEITSFPISALKESSTRYYYLVSLLMDCQKKGFISCSVPLSVSRFYSKVKFFRSTRTRELKLKSGISETVILLLRDTITAKEAFYRLSRCYGYRFPWDINIDYKLFFANIARELFTKSDPTSLKIKCNLDLGLLAEEWVLQITLGISVLDTTNRACDLDPWMIPILGCYGLVEEMFMDLRHKEVKIDQSSEYWPLLLRSYTIPLSDKVFTMRSEKLTPLASATFGAQSEGSFKLLLFSGVGLKTDRGLCTASDIEEFRSFRQGNHLDVYKRKWIVLYTRLISEEEN